MVFCKDCKHYKIMQGDCDHPSLYEIRYHHIFGIELRKKSAIGEGDGTEYEWSRILNRKLDCTKYEPKTKLQKIWSFIVGGW